MLSIIGLIIAAILAGSLVCLGVTLTVSALKKYKQKKNSKVLATTVKDLIDKAPTMKLDDIESDDIDGDDIILAEYDEENDELVQDLSYAKEASDKVNAILKANGGMVVFD